MLPGAIGGFVGMNPSCPKHAVDPGLGHESVHRVIVMEVDGVMGEMGNTISVSEALYSWERTYS